jgi:hypothetical protein
VRRRRGRLLVAAFVLVLAGGALAWRCQSQLIGVAARWYLERVAARDAAAGEVARRQVLLARLHGLLLMPPPPPGMVEELFDYATLLSYPVATGRISLAWASYLYTSHLRDLVRDRPTGAPRHVEEELRAELAREVDFFTLRKRPDVDGIRLRDLAGVPADSYTAEEIERAAREGRQLELR